VPKDRRAFTQWEAIRHVRAQLASEKGVKVAVEPLRGWTLITWPLDTQILA